MVGELMRIAYRHQLQLPPALALLFKVVVMLESAAVLIDPNLLFFEALEDEMAAHLKNEISPARISRRLARDAVEMARLIDGLPQRADRLLQRLETGDLEFAARHEGLERRVDKLNQTIRTLTIVIGVSMFLVAAGVFVLAAETAGPPGSGRVNALRALLTIAGAISAMFVARMWWTQRR